jgi:hypothetical protein
MTFAASTCPYCGRPFSAGGGPTKDHIFVEALGGKATVQACRECNSTIGNEIEGELLRPGTALHFVNQLRGAAKPIRSTLGAGGPQIEHQIDGTEIFFRQPITKTTDEGTLNIQMRSGVKQAEAVFRQLTKGLELNADEAAEIWDSRQVQSVGGEFVQVSITYNLHLARRLAVKVALGALWLALGDSFASSALAAELRTFLWGDGNLIGDQCSSEALPESQDLVNAFLEKAGAEGSITFVPSTGKSQVSMLTVGNRVTPLVTLGGWDLTLVYAPMFADRLPQGGNFPVIIEDGSPMALREIESEFGSKLNEAQGKSLKEFFSDLDTDS